MRRGILLAEAAFLLAVSVFYLITLAPFLFWRDAPEFVDAVTTLGVAHPAGFPTYNLLARLAWMLPLANIPFRINLFSALCAVGALAIFIRTSAQILALRGTEEREARLISLAAAGIIAVGAFFWESALSAEVYPLHLLCIALVLHLAVRWYASGDDRLIYLCALVYGLSAGNHATMAFLLPGLLLFFCLKNHTDTFRKLLVLGTFFLIGFSVYLYLPIRSSTYPNMDWGEPRTLWQLFAHMTDRKDSTAHADFLAGGEWGWGTALAMQGSKILGEITFLGVALALVGIVWNLRQSPLTMVLLGLTFLPHGVFFIHWQGGNIHLQLFLVLGFWMAMGMRQISEWGASRKLRLVRPWKILPLLVAAIIVMQIALTYRKVDQSENQQVELSIRKDFSAMENDALCIATILWFHFRAYQDVMRLREDVTLLGSSFFLAPEYFMRVTPQRFSRIPVPEGGYSRGDSGMRFLHRLVAMNMDERRPVYLEIYHSFNKHFFQNVLPDQGFLFRFTLEPIKRLDSALIYHYLLSLRDRMLREVESGEMLREKEVYHYYTWFLLAIVDYLSLHNDWGNVLRLLEFVEKFFGPQGLDALLPNERHALYSNMAASFINTGQYDRAKSLLEDLVARCRECYADYRNLAWLYYRERRFKEAEVWLHKGLKEKPIASQSLELLGDIELVQGRISAAREAYQRALEVELDMSRRKNLEQKIERLAPPEVVQ